LLFHDNMQGIILSKALKAQRDAEEEDTQIAINNLLSKVIELWYSVEEKILCLILWLKT
jgi:hypothetical protein